MAQQREKPSYGWIIVSAFFVIGTMIFGAHFSFGVFFKSIGGEFGLPRTVTSSIFSVQNVFGAVFSFIGGCASDKYGPRATGIFIGLLAGISLILTSQTSALWQLYITYSLLFSVIGAVYIVIASTVTKWFSKDRGLALAIAGMGIALGPVVIAPFAAYLIASVDWRMAYIILGLIAWFLIIPSSAWLRRSPAEIIAEPQGITTGFDKAHIPPAYERNQINGLSLQAASRTRSFWLFAVSWFLYSVCYMLVMVHLVPHATDIGIPPVTAAAVLSLIGASSIAGRLIMGKVSDAFGRRRVAIPCALLLSVSMLLLIRAQELSMLYIFGIAFGLFQGGIDTLFPALFGDSFGLRHLGRIMGALGAAFGIGAIIGPAIGGYCFDINDSYTMAFLIGGLSMFVSFVLVILTRRETSPD